MKALEQGHTWWVRGQGSCVPALVLLLIKKEPLASQGMVMMVVEVVVGVDGKGGGAGGGERGDDGDAELEVLVGC